MASSLLRYPGGKSRFKNFIFDSISVSGENPGIFIEPFCGGAGVSISLLETNRVARIALNDVDPLVSSFWKVIFGKSCKSDSDISWFVDLVSTSELSIDEWRRQKAVIPTTIKQAAWKCFYLNRTSFNGILHKGAGPIGGYEQRQRTLDVRFNRENLIKRTLELYKLRERVETVECEDWAKFCNYYRNTTDSYLYLDPPYYHKASKLYGYVFDEKTHIHMLNYLVNYRNPWMLSYDDAVEVRMLYGDMEGIDGRVIDNTYSAHPVGGNSFVGRELFFSNRPLPRTEAEPVYKPHTGLTILGGLNMFDSNPIGPLRTPLCDLSAI